MDRGFKLFVEKRYDFLVELYNRYIKFQLKKNSDIEYYSSPYMNLIGYPDEEFINFCKVYYNKKFSKNILVNKKKMSFVREFFSYLKLVIIFVTSPLFFSKNIKKDSAVVHAFHSNEYFKKKPYVTLKTPPFEHLKKENVYHDINISFIKIRDLVKYKGHDIVSSIRYLSLMSFIKLHFIAAKSYYSNRKINLMSISYSRILYTLVKGKSIANLINKLDESSYYLNMWENRGHNLITDYLIQEPKKSIFLDLGIMFRLSQYYMVLNYQRHQFNSNLLFMSEFNYDLVKKNFNGLNPWFYKNFRIDNSEIKDKVETTKILLIAPLSESITDNLYELIGMYNNLDIKIKLHPYTLSKKYEKKYLETRSIYNILDDYSIIIYSGITTAVIELYFQGKEIYKYVNDEFFDIDPLIDNKLVNKIDSLDNIQFNKTSFTDEEKNYYLGYKNKELKDIVKEIIE